MSDPSLGLIMILKDEAENLPHSLAPLAGCFNEVVAVDTGSSDATVNICRELGARVYHFDWVHDFSAARNYSIKMAESDWLLWLDGDNAIDPGGVEQLRAKLPTDGPAVLWATEKVIPAGHQLWQKRCFPNNGLARFQGRVHEQLVHPREWPAIFTELVVSHWGYVDPKQLAITGRYYLDLLNQMLEDDPTDYYSHFQAARCLINLRDFKTADKHLDILFNSEEAKAKNPGLWAYGIMLWAQLMQNTGKPQAGLELLDRVLTYRPELGILHYQKARICYTLGGYQQASEHFQQSLKFGLGAPVVDLDQRGIIYMTHYFLAKSLLKLGDAGRAAGCFEQAVKTDPANISARVDLAELLLKMGQRAKAKTYIQEVLANQPGDRAALRLLKRCEAK
jgi:glycosyltransferase involved in cell wall biosynthesis